MVIRLGGTSYHVKESIDPYGHIEWAHSQFSGHNDA